MQRRDGTAARRAFPVFRLLLRCWSARCAGGTHAFEAHPDHSDRHGARHSRRLRLPYPVAGSKTAKTIADYISLFTEIFLRLIKMIIAPLVFSTLVVGVAHMGDTKAIGRIGVKAMAWFVGASLVSLLVGMILVNLLR